MRVFNLIWRNKLKVSLFCLVTLIIGVCIAIFLLGQNTKPAALKNTSSLKGYDVIQNELALLGSDPSISDTAPFQSIVEQMPYLEDNSLNEKQKFDKIVIILDYLIDLTGITNNPKVYPMFDKLGIFSKENFPHYYKPGYFEYFCQDPSCAQHPQPKEIIQIIDEIKSSDIDATIKKTVARDLTNAGFIEDKYKQQRFNSYIIVADEFYTSDSSFSPSNKAKLIGKELLDYLKISYPKEYDEYQKNATANAGGK